MRIWSLHPQYLDRRGLVALWREALLAQAVLRGKTTGYVHHPQLIRFRGSGAPVGCVANYLWYVHQEAIERGYRFDLSRVARRRPIEPMVVTAGQLEYEWRHLQEKLRSRDPDWLKGLGSVNTVRPHPMFDVVGGDVESWEKR